jgi:maltose O-acetyltransferase
MFLDWNSRRRWRRIFRELHGIGRRALFAFAGLAVVTPSIRTTLYRLGRLDIHRDSSIQSGLTVRGNRLTIGRGTTVNQRCLIDCIAQVTIGERCGIAYGVSIITAGHDWSEPHRRAGVEEYRKIQIGNGVWIGSNAVILPGVTIGDGVVIGAGSVVNRDCDANSFYAGTPAKYVRTLPMGDQTDSPQ